MFIILLFVHNIFYLKRVYIRSRKKSIDNYIVLDFEDESFRFGLHGLDLIFDLQIIILILVGAVLVVSRYAYVTPVKLPFQWIWLLQQAFSGNWEIVQKSIELLLKQWGGLFPTLGHWVIAIAWILGYLVISIPALAKFLPLISSRLFSLDRAEYFREFIPPENEKSHPEDEHGKYDLSTIPGGDYVEMLFNKQSFWPIGDKNAEHLFIFVWFVFIVLLVPVEINLASLITLLILAWVWSKFVLFTMRLIYLDFNPVKKSG
jgi:hypothetical protein